MGASPIAGNSNLKGGSIIGGRSGFHSVNNPMAIGANSCNFIKSFINGSIFTGTVPRRGAPGATIQAFVLSWILNYYYRIACADL